MKERLLWTTAELTLALLSYGAGGDLVEAAARLLRAKEVYLQ